LYWSRKTCTKRLCRSSQVVLGGDRVMDGDRSLSCVATQVITPRWRSLPPHLWNPPLSWVSLSMLVSESVVAELGSPGECASPGVLGNAVTIDLEVFPELRRFAR
jgi:hypothetical protein